MFIIFGYTYTLMARLLSPRGRLVAVEDIIIDTTSLCRASWTSYL